MKEKNNQKRLLLILLWGLLGCIIVLVIVNAFFIWQLYFVKSEEPSKDELVGQTLTVVIAQNGFDETPVPVQATEIPQPTAIPDPATATITPESQGRDTFYIVRQGDTPSNIAESFGIKIEDLRAKNQMLGDFILTDQTLVIPQQGEIVDPVVEYSSLLAVEDYLWLEQVIEDEGPVFAIYMEEERFAFRARTQLIGLVQNSFDFVANTIGGDAPDNINVFVASGPFKPQFPIRAHYLTADERLHILHDGSGNDADLNFHLTYGMGRLWGEQVWGGSPDAVLREGMAYSIADASNFGRGNLELCDVARVYQQMDKLPVLTAMNNLDTEWTRNMLNLSTAGCYYTYLTETYAADTVQALYQTGDYSALDSENFSEEEALFEAWLSANETSQEIDAEMFVKQMDRLLVMNKLFFSDFEGWENSIDIYYALDQARLGLWRNDVRYAMVRMTTAGAMLGLTTNVPTPEITPTEENGNTGSPPAATPEETPFSLWTPWPTRTPRPTSENPFWPPDSTDGS